MSDGQSTYGHTTVSLSRETHDRLGEMKPDSVTWDEWLNNLADKFAEGDGDD